MNRIRLTPALLRSVLFLLVLTPAILAACTSNPQSTFDARGPVAEDQKNIFLLIFWIAAVVFVLVEGALIYAIIRYRKKRPGPDLPKQVHGNQQLEIGLTIATILVLAVIAVPTVLLVFDQAEGPIDGKTPVDPLHVTAIAHQWWFEYEYDGEDVFTANELHIPVGRTTIVNLESDDVIHSFWAPKLGGKVDMIPGATNELFLYTDEVGNFSGQCAEFCGEAHANMRFKVVTHEPEDFRAWLEAMRRPPSAPEPGSDEAAGQALFGENCSTCHTIRSYVTAIARSERDTQESRNAAFRANPTDSGIVSAPNLTHFGLRQEFAAGLETLTEANLVEWINDPDDIKLGNRMKDLAKVYSGGDVALSDQEIRQIAKYLIALVPGEADEVMVEPAAPDGKAIFAANCAGCHSESGDQGVGPGLGGFADRAGSRVDGLGAEEYVTQSIIDPNAYVVEEFNPNVMPGVFGATFSDEEVSALVNYVLSLK